MRWGWRLLPWAVLQRRYLEGGEGRFGGFWYDEALLLGHSPVVLSRLLGLSWWTPDGSAAFEDLQIGVLRFEANAQVLENTQMAAARGLGGRIPAPSCPLHFSGTGFAPGESLIPEYRLTSTPLVAGTEALAIGEDGGVWRVARWLGGEGGQWVSP